MDPKEQFDRQAKYYANSPTFSSGLSLDLLSKLLKNKTKKWKNNNIYKASNNSFNILLLF